MSFLDENNISFPVIIKIAGRISGHFATILQIISINSLNSISINIKAYLLPIIIDTYMRYYKLIETISIKIKHRSPRLLLLHVSQLKTRSKAIICPGGKLNIPVRIQRSPVDISVGITRPRARTCRNLDRSNTHHIRQTISIEITSNKLLFRKCDCWINRSSIHLRRNRNTI